MLAVLYVLAATALVVATGAVYLALAPAVPSTWVYYHYRVRKPTVWLLLAVGVLVVGWTTARDGAFPLATLAPLLLLVVALIAAYRMHQEVVFPAADYPPMATDPLRLPLADDMALAVIEYDGTTKAFPLDYVIHHHIVNDRFGDKTVALTYCAMCHSVIPFDVTDLGPLLVGSFKNANMVVADRRTKTFFQQATFESLAGPRHPHTLTMIQFQILSWADVKKLDPLPQVVDVTEKDLRPFELPIHGLWRRIMASEVTPGLRRGDHDESMPARTRVVGILEPTAHPRPVYRRDDLLQRRIVRNDRLDCYLVAVNGAVNGFREETGGHSTVLELTDDAVLHDQTTGTDWDLRGHRIRGALDTDLTPISVSDEYWFSWKFFHPDTEVIDC